MFTVNILGMQFRSVFSDGRILAAMEATPVVRAHESDAAGAAAFVPPIGSWDAPLVRSLTSGPHPAVGNSAAPATETVLAATV